MGFSIGIYKFLGRKEIDTVSNIEIARLVTAIIISAMASYAIGYIMSYIITWRSAVEIFKDYREALAGCKDVINGFWQDIYTDDDWIKRIE